MSSSFYKNVVLKTLRTKMRKVRPKTGSQHVHLLHDLCGRSYRFRSALGSAIHKLLMGVPKVKYENCFKNWIKKIETMSSG